ncbi:MAG: hypothetical protein OXG44_01485 [Gammaproteobacteria bacterium]|nr:hypothetical protein [Gammaproteobacteria bacterium]
MAGKLTAAERKKAMAVFLEEYARVGLMRPAARAAGVDVSTIHRWRKRYKGFASDFEECRREIRAHFDDAIMRAALGGDWRAAAHGIDLMGRKAPDRGKQGGKGANGAPRVVEVTEEVSAILKDVLGGETDEQP